MTIVQPVKRRLLSFKPKKLPKFGKISEQRKTPVAIVSLTFLAFLVLVTLSISTWTHSSTHSVAAGLASLSLPPPSSLEPTLPSTPPSPPLQQIQPVEPFPTSLNAQIATLEAHNRYFFQCNPNLPEIALTFDDGPNPGYTEQILAVLEKYHVKATFFDVGRLVQLYPELVRRELNDGNQIGNHSWNHADLPYLSLNDIKTQLKTTSDIIQKVTGIRPTFMRPPYGDVSADVLTAINSFGLTGVIWNDAASDWLLPGSDVIAARILNQASNGTIVLLHDGGGNRAQTAAALPTIITQLLARHYRFVTMAEMAAHNLLKKVRSGNTTLLPPTTPAKSFLVCPQTDVSWIWLDRTALMWQNSQERKR